MSTIIKLRAIACAASLLVAGYMLAQSDSTSAVRSLMPTFHGVTRVFYEQTFADGGNSRFMVRNARLSASGIPLPKFEYFLQVDFCDRGKIVLLDANIRYNINPGLRIYAGQMSVPLSIDGRRQPQQYYFVSKSYLGKYAALRSVGVKTGYYIPSTPIYVEGGVFNGSSRTDHSKWNKSLTFSISANATLPLGFKPQIGFRSRGHGLKSEGCRINIFDVSLHWAYSRWVVEAEYLAAVCTENFPTSHMYDFLVVYTVPVHSTVSKALSFAARFDGNTDITDGVIDTNGLLNVSSPSQKRITCGVTSSISHGSANFDFRVNYEHFFCSKAKSPDTDNRLTFAAILYF